MEFEIGQDVLSRADRCVNSFRCLNGVLCEAEAQLFGQQRFICHDANPCAYKVPFGCNFFCTCPVRRAVFEKYEV